MRQCHEEDLNTVLILLVLRPMPSKVTLSWSNYPSSFLQVSMILLSFNLSSLLQSSVYFMCLIFNFCNYSFVISCKCLPLTEKTLVFLLWPPHIAEINYFPPKPNSPDNYRWTEWLQYLLGVLLASNVDASSLPGIAPNTLLLHMQAYKLSAFSSYFSDPLPM